VAPAPHLLALDIETTGLDVAQSCLVAVGLATAGASDVRISGHEAGLLTWLEDRVQHAPAGTTLITWNGEEFDLPFLRHRFLLNDLETSLTLTQRSAIGKYGKPLYAARWASVPHVDVAEQYRAVADDLGIPWRLKPVARAVLGVEPVEVDNRGEAIAVLDEDLLANYLRSDIEITLALAERLVESGDLQGVPAP
jgi:DNA polymerase elongation subunit (family B)